MSRFDDVIKGYAEGHYDKEWLKQFLWTMGAGIREIGFLLEAADKMKEHLEKEKIEKGS